MENYPSVYPRHFYGKRDREEEIDRPIIHGALGRGFREEFL